jgi:hypothetical protein
VGVEASIVFRSLLRRYRQNNNPFLSLMIDKISPMQETSWAQTLLSEGVIITKIATLPWLVRDWKSGPIFVLVAAQMRKPKYMGHVLVKDSQSNYFYPLFQAL